MEKQTLIFLGTQGSGKGTQIGFVKEWLAQHDPDRPIVHVEMGKSLRILQERQDYTGKQTLKILSGGNLIPYAVSSTMFTNYLIDNIKTGDEHVIIDGFPRTAEQVPTLDSIVEFFNRPSVTVIYLNISDEEAMKRLIPRKRYDDTEEGIRKRLAWSREQTIPNLEWFRQHAPRYKVIEVFGERPIEVVQAEIREKLGFV